MAGIPLASNFDLTSPLPLDSRLQVENLTARNALSNGIRYEGMKVYVKNEQKTYVLKGGVANSNFKEIITEETTQALAAEIEQLKQNGGNTGGTSNVIVSATPPTSMTTGGLWYQVLP